jgi:hypothetical protein
MKTKLLPIFSCISLFPVYSQVQMYHCSHLIWITEEFFIISSLPLPQKKTIRIYYGEVEKGKKDQNV